MQIDQETTFERQAFEARLNISNPGLMSLENLSIAVQFADENQESVLASSDPNNATAKFFIRLSSSETLPAAVPAGTTQNLRWLIVPAASAGGTESTGKLYYVGAKLTYTLGGVDTVIDVSPDSIRVQPMPSLTLDYFLPKDVYGDDPFTPVVEPSIPFPLGVRVKNSGAGTARNLKIESSQPRIVENQQGLAVKFQIQGSEVNGSPATASLLADFGDILPSRSGVGRWLMTSSLYGRFTEFSATFSHDDGLGGKLTSLITDVHTHELVRDVLIDLPGRDQVRDFLALDGNSLRVYESENSDASVADWSASAAIAPSGRTYTVTLQPEANPGDSPVALSYLKLPDPAQGTKVLKRVTRGDGKAISSNNAWLSSTYAADQQAWQHSLNIFDTNNAARLPYTVVLENENGVNQPPVLQKLVPVFTAANTPITVPVFASDPDQDPITLGTGSLPEGAVFTTTGTGMGKLTWTPTLAQLGFHSVEFTATDGEFTDRKTVVIGVTAAGEQFSNWQNFFWPGVADAHITGLYADPDGDGFLNLAEYMLGMNPTSGELLGQPKVTTVMVEGKPYLALLYHSRSDINYQVLAVATRSLTGPGTSWLPSTDFIPQDQSQTPSGFAKMLVRDSKPMNAEDKRRFMRLEVSERTTP